MSQLEWSPRPTRSGPLQGEIWLGVWGSSAAHCRVVILTTQPWSICQKQITRYLSPSYPKQTPQIRYQTFVNGKLFCITNHQRFLLAICLARHETLYKDTPPPPPPTHTHTHYIHVFPGKPVVWNVRKMLQVVPRVMFDQSWKFHENSYICFCSLLLTDTNSHRKIKIKLYMLGVM